MARQSITLDELRRVLLSVTDDDGQTNGGDLVEAITALCEPDEEE